MLPEIPGNRIFLDHGKLPPNQSSCVILNSPKTKRSIGHSNQCPSSLLSPPASNRSRLPPEETQVKVEHPGPKPLRPSAAGLCGESLALAYCECQSRNNHKSAKEDRMKFRPLYD